MMDLRKAQFARGVYGLGYHDVFVSYTKSKGDGDLPDHDWFITVLHYMHLVSVYIKITFCLKIK